MIAFQLSLHLGVVVDVYGHVQIVECHMSHRPDVV